MNLLYLLGSYLLTASVLGDISFICGGITVGICETNTALGAICTKECSDDSAGA